MTVRSRPFASSVRSLPKRIALSLVLLFAVWVAGFAPGAHAAGTLLKNADLHALLVDGALFDTASPDGYYLGTFALLRHGPAYTLWRGHDGTGGADTGTWRLVGDAVCITWGLLDSSKNYCVQFFRRDDGQLESRRATDGVLRFILSPRKS